VRWGVFERAAHRLQHVIEMLENLVVPESDDAVATARELGAPSLVRGHPLGMLPAVEFDDELARRTGEIGNPPTNRMLPAEFPRHDALAQRPPEDALDIRRLAPEASRDLCPRSELLCHPTSPNPLRPGGAERGKIIARLCQQRIQVGV
jgi:hypothetical protein